MYLAGYQQSKLNFVKYLQTSLIILYEFYQAVPIPVRDNVIILFDDGGDVALRLINQIIFAHIFL